MLLQNRYRLDVELGRGGMGVVYRAHDTLLDRPVAVKLLSRPDLGSEGRARLLNEARAAARLDHPNIVAVYDAGEADEAGSPAFIVMQLVEGRSLHDLPAASLDETLAIVAQVCAALEHAHNQGIVHRDLKPENVMVTEDGTAKLMDFGLALSAATRLTTEGALVGTVFYFAPEQALGQELDGRADLYALGVMLYERVTGRLPFTGDDPLAVISQHLYAPIVPPSTLRPDLPYAIEEVILKLMAKTPAERYASAAEVAAALAAAKVGEVGEAPTPEPAGVVALLQGLARGRLVGRRAEVSQLRDLWARALQGHAHLALVSGEPGIGKTRLANEIQVAAQLTGAAILRGGCYEYEAATPYLPFAEALSEWVRGQDTDRLRSLVGAAAPELAKLAPELEARLGPLAANPPLSPAEDRLRLFDHVARFLRTLAAQDGLLFFIDDLHWADQGTLALLHYILRHLRDDRVLVLAAYREVELDRAHPLAASLVEWNRERLATRLALGRLSLDDTSALLAALFGQVNISAEFAAVIHRETEGNPFFVEEVIKSLIEQGQIYRENGGWGRNEVGDLAIPQSIKEAIGRRLNRLSPACIEALHAAAALGKVFAFDELAAVAAPAGGEDQLLNALDEAGAAQLIRAGTGENFVFTHDKIREVLYEELNPIRRRRLHQRIAEALLALYAANLDAHIEDLAYHFTEAGDLSQSLAYALRAAEKAARLFLLEEALRYYESAHEAAEALNLHQHLVAVYEGRGDVYFWQGHNNQAIDSLQQALRLADEPEKRAVLKSKIGAAYTGAGYEEGHVYLQEALAELNPQTQTAALALATSTLGRYYHLHGHHQRAVETFHQAQQLAESLDDPHTLTLIYAYLSGAYQHLALYDQSMEWARRCIAYGEQRNYPLARAIGSEFLAEDLVMLGRWPEALAHAREDSRIGEMLGAPDRVSWGEFSVGQVLLGQGNLAAAATAAEATVSLAASLGDLRLVIISRSLLATCQAALGQLEAARQNAEAAYADEENSRQTYLLTESSLALAAVYRPLGRWAEAAELFEKCYAVVVPTDNRLNRMRMYAPHAEALLGVGRLEEAARKAAEAVALSHDIGSAYYEAIGRRVQGQVWAAQGRPAEALQEFDAAAQALAELGSRLELARAIDQRGRLRLALGHLAAARADWTQALALFTECGAELAAAATRDALDTLPPST